MSVFAAFLQIEEKPILLLWRAMNGLATCIRIGLRECVVMFLSFKEELMKWLWDGMQFFSLNPAGKRVV
jgi:hypothetical protein